MTRTIHLHGALGELHGESHEYDADSMRDLLGLLILNQPEVKQTFSSGRYRVYLGTEPAWCELDEGTLNVFLGDQDVHIFPVIEGAGGDAKGIIAGILGVALLATGIGLAISAGGLAGAGLSIGALGTISAKSLIMVGGILALSGISSLLAPAPNTDYKEREKPDERASFLFDGPRNRVEQGGCVPVVYGTMRVGGTIVSAGITVEQIGTTVGEGGGGLGAIPVGPLIVVPGPNPREVPEDYGGLEEANRAEIPDPDDPYYPMVRLVN